MSTWHLEDVVATARTQPDSFFIPSETERHECREGDLVRLHFVLNDPQEGEPRAERMWVEVTERLGGNGALRYRGLLTNESRPT